MKADWKYLTDILPDAISVYLSNFIKVLNCPGLIFPPIPQNIASQSDLAHPSMPGFRLNPRLISFVIVSMIIGSTLNTLIPKNIQRVDGFWGTTGVSGSVSMLVIVASLWFAFSIFAYIAARLLFGRGTWLETVSISLQLLAVANVLGNFVAIFWGQLVGLQFIFGALSSAIHNTLGFSNVAVMCYALIVAPAYFYLVCQFLFLVVYIPISLKNVHRFGVIRQSILGVVVAVAVMSVNLFLSRLIPLGLGGG